MQSPTLAHGSCASRRSGHGCSGTALARVRLAVQQPVPATVRGDEAGLLLLPPRFARRAFAPASTNGCPETRIWSWAR